MGHPGELGGDLLGCLRPLRYACCAAPSCATCAAHTSASYPYSLPIADIPAVAVHLQADRGHKRCVPHPVPPVLLPGWRGEGDGVSNRQHVSAAVPAVHQNSQEEAALSCVLCKRSFPALPPSTQSPALAGWSNPSNSQLLLRLTALPHLTALPCSPPAPSLPILSGGHQPVCPQLYQVCRSLGLPGGRHRLLRRCVWVLLTAQASRRVLLDCRTAAATFKSVGPALCPRMLGFLPPVAGCPAHRPDPRRLGHRHSHPCRHSRAAKGRVRAQHPAGGPTQQARRFLRQGGLLQSVAACCMGLGVVLGPKADADGPGPL